MAIQLYDESEGNNQIELRTAALEILAMSVLEDKLAACARLQGEIQQKLIALDVNHSFSKNDVFIHQTPGRPTFPSLVSALDVPRRKVSTQKGLIIMVHALAHIEFNAINLALDVIVRFSSLPDDFYWDWWQVAFEESIHFSMLRDHLQTLGVDYGHFEAHNGLWEMALSTQDSLADRMAMIPRTLEARGLDACPLTRDKFLQAGDAIAANIVDIILHDEIGHVALGNRWFIYACERDNVEPIFTYREIKNRMNAPRLRPPFNLSARRLAGFFEEELQEFEDLNNN